MSAADARREALRTHLSDVSLVPACSRLFGFRLIDLDPKEQWVEASFEARADFLNPNGSVQGGIVTGFLDEVMSLAALVATDMTHGVPTLEMKTSFLRPLPIGQCRARGQVMRLGRSVAFTEGRLWNGDGALCATATATAALRPIKGQTRGEG